MSDKPRVRISGNAPHSVRANRDMDEADRQSSGEQATGSSRRHPSGRGGSDYKPGQSASASSRPKVPAEAPKANADKSYGAPMGPKIVE
jgi:hypothetical protein